MMFRKEVKVFKEYPICTECEEGHLEATGESHTCIETLIKWEKVYFPGGRPDFIVHTHQCTSCGDTVDFHIEYPTIVYEEVSNE